MIYILLPLFYCVGFGLTIALRQYCIENGIIKKNHVDNNLGNVIFGSLWPLYTPVLLSYLFFRKIPDIKLPKKKDELFEGVQKPSSILMGMVASKIIRDFEKVETVPSRYTLNHPSGMKYNVQNIKVEANLDYYGEWEVIEVLVADKYFDDDGQLLKALLEATELKKQKKEAEALYRQEENALLAIEKLV